MTGNVDEALLEEARDLQQKRCRLPLLANLSRKMRGTTWNYFYLEPMRLELMMKRPCCAQRNNA